MESHIAFIDSLQVLQVSKLTKGHTQILFPTITYHLKEIYKTGELEEPATTRIFRVVQKEGKRKVNRDLDFYNLDVIIALVP